MIYNNNNNWRFCKAAPRFNGCRIAQYGFCALILLLALNLPAQADHQSNAEAYNNGWSFQLDNDLLAGGVRDQDYTGGAALTLSGRRATEYRFTPDRFRSALDHLLGFERLLNREDHYSMHALEIGSALFTPKNINKSEANPLDRPYASLLFLNSTRQTILPNRKLSFKSGFTIGVLGLGFAENTQKTIHKTIGSDLPKGWQHQISRGGELTFKYAVSAQKAASQRVFNSGLAQEINWTAKADAGFTTGVGAGFNWRFGRINTPWWSFNPHQSDYINLGANIASGSRVKTRVQERYIYAGSTINYTLYNAFVQGQFRRSAVRVDRADVNPVSAEIWGGFSTDIGSSLRVDMFLRSRTRDIELPESKRLVWGGFTIGRRF